MKKSIITIFIISAILFISSCCGNIQCDCIGQTISFSYKDMNQNCNENTASLISFSSYNNQTNEVIRENALYGAENCQFYVEYYNDIYWIATSDALGISDTLKLVDIDFIEIGGKDCCDCPPPVNTLSMSVNSTVYTGNNFTINY